MKQINLKLNLNLKLNPAWLITITKDRHHLAKKKKKKKKKREEGGIGVAKDVAKDYVKPAKSSVSPSVINQLNQSDTHQNNIFSFLNIRL